jgi:glycosyltransferase involved in cell wall biosynthesis
LLPEVSPLSLPRANLKTQHRVLHVESSLNWGGQEQRTVTEVQWLRRAGHEAWIACNPDSELARRYPELCLSVPLKRSFAPAASARLKALCLRHRVDVLHVHSPKDAWVCAPLHLTVGPPVVRSRQITNPVKPTWSRSIIYRRGCAHVVATSRSIRESLITRNAVEPERISTVGEGVDLEVFHPAVDGAPIRREFALPPDAVVFGIVAMIRGEKGHLEFVQAAREVAQRHPQARFLVVGEGIGDRAHEQQVRRLAAELLPDDVLIFTGFRRDVPAIMAALDVLVVPSLAEAQSLVVPQAFATRRAVIASDVGGLPELVTHEETGLLAPPGRVDALAAAMARLIVDAALRDRLAAAGHRVAVEQLSFGRKMEQTLEIYTRVAHEPAAQQRTRAARRRRTLQRASRFAGIAALLLLVWTSSLLSPLQSVGPLEENPFSGNLRPAATNIAPTAQLDEDDDSPPIELALMLPDNDDDDETTG